MNRPAASRAHDAAEIVFDSATKRYPGRERPAVSSLSLTVAAGEICVLVGPSGAGKTTAMKMVNRLVELSEGDVRIDGRSVRTLDVNRLRRGIGYVIQQIGLFPHMTVAQNVATVPRLEGWERARISARVDELLELVGLDARDDGSRYPTELSGGQRQRVGLARAMAADPPLMLMDEPFGALDPLTRERLQDEFLRLHESIRKTVIFVTHDIDEAIKMGDRVAVLRQGGDLAQHATPDQLLAAPADDFVARFVGGDRALKRLALARLGDLALEPASRASPGAPGAPASTSLREALSLMLDGGGGPLVVKGSDGRPAGTATLEMVSQALARGDGEPA